MCVCEMMVMLTESPVFSGSAHVLSAEEAEKHSVHDVVMPLPGFDVIYPTHSGEAFWENLDIYKEASL